jgi:hypothetical protein
MNVNEFYAANPERRSSRDVGFGDSTMDGWQQAMTGSTVSIGPRALGLIEAARGPALSPACLFDHADPSLARAVAGLVSALEQLGRLDEALPI